MKVTRRQTLAALAATVGALAVRASSLGRLSLMPKPSSKRRAASEHPRDITGRRPSRRVEPAAHSVKRHE